MTIRVSLLVCLVSLGCGGDITDLLPSRGSCNVPTTGTCTDYVGTAWSTPSSGSRACQMVGNGAVYASTACATGGRVGSCRVSSGSASELAIRYYSTRFTAALATQVCAQMGGQYVSN